MIVLYTKKLQQFLELNDRGTGLPLPDFTNPDALWHGNIFLIDRKKVLQLTHEASRYTIFIHGVTKKDLPQLNQIVLEHLRYHMLKDSIPLKEMTYIDSMSSKSFSYFKKINRSVLGTMKNMKLIYENNYYSNENISDKEITQHINHMLITISGKYVHPVEVFKKYMSEAVAIRGS
ncbi:hypothetical protein JHD48_09645 [Sulfurimonas sp. SAG-AH-194-I05]|nr:hypothetical protein [Sulfurimonas sp. SAG-AH-194-I05]MDF1875998.1 hypothetical protein [Sulfurimonas sp. SAG-AH-194-I05]